MILILLGAPGSGKGTQAKRLTDKLGLTHLSTGDILREAVKNGAELGKKAEGYMKVGELVPDDLIIDMITARIEGAADSAGFMLDGFPRNLTQAEKLDEIFTEKNLTVDQVIYLNVPEDELVKRLSGRFYCPTCNAGYNYPMHLPKSEGVCDNDGEKLLRRHDDEEDVVQRRLAVYREQTSPLEDYYRGRGNLVEIEATNSPDNVTQAIISSVARVKSA